MYTEQKPKFEQNIKPKHHDIRLEQKLIEYNLIQPEQSLIFMVYDPKDGAFTHVHKFTSKSVEGGVLIEYKDNENFLNKNESREDHEDYDMLTTLF